MKKTVSCLASITQIDPHTPTWLIQAASLQWYAKGKDILVDPVDEDYVAIVTIDIETKAPISFTAPLSIKAPSKVLLAHYVWCSSEQHEAQMQLWAGAAQIEDPILKDFVTGILHDTQIMEPFYRGKASKGYHHNAGGELFLHSVEVAVNAAQLAKQYGLPQRTQDCVFIGGLLHDIGKILMHYNLDNKDQKGVSGQHEAFSFLVLADHLDKLKKHDKSLFEAMSAMLSPHIANKKHHDYIEECVVRVADWISAHKYERGTAFLNKPANQLYANVKGGRVYRRLSEQQE